MLKYLVPLVCVITLSAFSEDSEKVTAKLKGDRLSITRVFANGVLTESYQAKWMKQPVKMPKLVDKVERFLPSGVEAKGFWLRDGKYVLEKNGTPWISGTYQSGKCLGDWVEADPTGKPKRRVTCRNGIPYYPNSVATEKGSFSLEVTDFHFEVGQFRLRMDQQFLSFQLPRHDILLYQGKPVTGRSEASEILIPIDKDYLQRNRERAKALGFKSFQDKYTDKEIVDGTTRTFAWRDGSQEKSISCYVECPEVVKKFYRETVDDFFQSPANALELSALGVYFHPDR